MITWLSQSEALMWTLGIAGLVLIACSFFVVCNNNTLEVEMFAIGTMAIGWCLIIIALWASTAYSNRITAEKAVRSAKQEQQLTQQRKLDVEKYASKIGERCGARVESNYREIALTYSGGGRRNGPYGAYQDMLVYSCDTPAPAGASTSVDR